MRPFNDTSLLGYKIKKLQECEQVDQIIVGSDCDLILKYAEQLGATPVKRPDEACDEELCSANEMIADLCGRIKTDVVVWTHCTNPNISPNTYGEAIQAFLNNDNYDSLLSVNIVKEHLWTSTRIPFNYNPWGGKHILAKDLPKLYKQNGAFFIQPHEQMLKNSYFFGRKPFLFVTPEEESTDINTEIDFKIAEVLSK